MTRRTLLAGKIAGITAAMLRPPGASAQAPACNSLGGAPAGFPIRTRANRDAGRPFDFVDHCHQLGLGVVETRLPAGGADAIPAFRRKLESYRMRLILDVGYPRDEAGVAAFDASVKAAKECGAISLHVAMTGRRYEDMHSREDFQKDFGRCQKSVELAEPVLRRHRIPMGIENHKGWRSAEQAAWLGRIGSEWTGVHFDFGNNLSLCEDPADTLRNLLPYIIACHIKDMAVEPYEDGFLLSEVPLGEGVLDIKGMVAALRGKAADMPFSLEMITRDPLRIPVYTDAYWATFNEASPLPGRDLARTLDLVRKHKPASPLPRTTGMSPEAQLKLEDDNVARSLAYARPLLGCALP